MDGGRWSPGGTDASGPSVTLTRLPLGQYLNANGWDTGWGGWVARVAVVFNWRYRFFGILEMGLKTVFIYIYKTI